LLNSKIHVTLKMLSRNAIVRLLLEIKLKLNGRKESEEKMVIEGEEADPMSALIVEKRDILLEIAGPVDRKVEDLEGRIGDTMILDRDHLLEGKIAILGPLQEGKTVMIMIEMIEEKDEVLMKEAIEKNPDLRVDREKEMLIHPLMNRVVQIKISR